MRRNACTLSLLAATTACNASTPSASSSFGTLPVTTALAEGTSSTSTGGSSGDATSPVHEDSTTGTSTGAGASAGTTLTLDVGVPDAGVPGPEGCRGKIDFLFVISRDYNMQLVQYKLTSALPKFIATIESRFADFDYHIMVVDSDAKWGNYICNDSCTPEGCPVEDYPCDLMDTLTECDTTLGAGVVFNAGHYTPNEPCTVAGSQRYLVKGQPDLAETFQCMATVGVNGYGWIGMALADAVTPAKTAHCNKGFIRDDALLFVSLIKFGTDESPFGTPAEWAQAVIDAKHGDPNAVVMFAIGPMSGLGWTDLESCADNPSGRLCRMLQFFPYRLLVDEAVPSYGSAFEQAADLVDEACSAFIPR